MALLTCIGLQYSVLTAGPQGIAHAYWSILCWPLGPKSLLTCIDLFCVDRWAQWHCSHALVYSVLTAGPHGLAHMHWSTVFCVDRWAPRHCSRVLIYSVLTAGPHCIAHMHWSILCWPLGPKALLTCISLFCVDRWAPWHCSRAFVYSVLTTGLYGIAQAWPPFFSVVPTCAISTSDACLSFQVQ